VHDQTNLIAKNLTKVIKQTRLYPHLLTLSSVPVDTVLYSKKWKKEAACHQLHYGLLTGQDFSTDAILSGRDRSIPRDLIWSTSGGVSSLKSRDTFTQGAEPCNSAKNKSKPTASAHDGESTLCDGVSPKDSRKLGLQRSRVGGSRRADNTFAARISIWRSLRRGVF